MVHAFLLIGQSNASGRGDLTEALRAFGLRYFEAFRKFQ